MAETPAGPAPAGLSELGALVRRADPDRYLAGLFAPAARREALWALYGFNHELARAREVAREPMACLIRLQWWREVVEGAHRRHPVATPLAAALRAGLLDPALLTGMVEAREAEAGTIETLEAFDAYLRGTAGALMVAAARLLGMADAEALRTAGAAYGLAGVLRAAPLLAGHGRVLLPAALMRAHRLTLGGVRDQGPGFARLRAELAGRARGQAQTAVPMPAAARAAALPLVLARRDLARPARMARARGTGDRLALSLAGLTGVGL